VITPRATSSKGAGASSGASGAAGAWPDVAPPKGRRPGDIAVWVALVFAVLPALYLPFYQVPADDRGEPLPAVFRGLAKLARETLTGEPVPDETVSLLEASGPQIFLVLALPVAVALFAVWANRRADRSRMLTFAMLAMAGAVVLTGGIGIYFFPALIALAVAGFRVRKADMPARVAERAVAREGRSSSGGGRGGFGGFGGFGGRARGKVIDADSVEAADSEADAPEADPTDAPVVDAPADSGAPAPAPAPDPLAELEAEIEAERAAEADAAGGPGDDTTDPGEAGGRGRSRRKR